MDGGSGNASGGGSSTCCYYALLGIRKNASATDIRTAYRRLAMVSSLAVHARAAASRRCLIDLVLCVSVSSSPLPNRPRSHVPISCRGRAEVAPGPVGQRPRRGRRGQAAVPADPGGILRSVGQGEEGHVRRRALRSPRRRRPGFLRLHAGDAGDDG